MGATVLAGLIATGLGLIAGGYYSVMGWILVGNLLLIVTAAAVIAAGTPPFLALGWISLVVVAYNAGLALSLVIRNTAVPQHA
jgi:hypothetical protein